jgi:hypothetical protein
MSFVNRIGSFIQQTGLGFQPEDPQYKKVGKVAAGVGAVALSCVFWKLAVIGAVSYSTFKATGYLEEKFKRRRVRERSEANDHPEEAHELVQPPEEVHQAEVAHEELELLPDVAEPPNLDARPTLLGLRKNATFFGRMAIDLVMNHPKIEDNSSNMLWMRKMLHSHGKWAKYTLGLSTVVVPVFRKIKVCFGCYPQTT